MAGDPYPMTPIRIFVSSVQSEFAHERRALRNYVPGCKPGCKPD